jgi:hypothetical protein
MRNTEVITGNEFILLTYLNPQFNGKGENVLINGGVIIARIP